VLAAIASTVTATAHASSHAQAPVSGYTTAFAVAAGAIAEVVVGEPFPRRAAGRRNVVAMLRSLSAPWDFFFQMTHSGVIDVNPDRQTATARCPGMMARRHCGELQPPRPQPPLRPRRSAVGTSTSPAQIR